MPGDVKKIRKNRGLFSKQTLLAILLMMLFPAMVCAEDDHLGQWTQRYAGAQLNGICYGNGQYVAVGNGGTILTSSDGANWTQQNSGTTNQLNAICYDVGRFVAVGNNGTVLTSSDGVTWIQRNSNSIGALCAVAYGAGKFMAMHGYTYIISSNYGVTWTQASTGSQQYYYGLCYNGRFVAVRSSAQILNYSLGSKSWLGAYGSGGMASRQLQAVCYGGGKTVAVGNGIAMFSNDGANWQKTNPQISSSYYLNSVCYGAGMFVALDRNGQVVTSIDANTWTYLTTIASNPKGICYNGRTFVSVGNNIMQNDATPTDISLSNDQVAEKVPAGTAVGTLSSVDSDTDETFTYSLVSGTGDTDNSCFTISGDTLSMTVVPDYDTQSNYSIRVKTTDYHGLSFEKVFNIYINKISELQSITAPDPISGVTNGTAKTAEALGLPSTVTLNTDNGSVNASVSWEVNECPYDMSSLAAQTFDISGTVTLPTDVVNPNNVSLTTSITVTVNAANPTLVSITPPSAISGLPNGTDKTAEALGLPSTVALVTDNSGSADASVSWAVNECPYDMSSLAAQTFDISGTVTLPTDVVNPNNVSLTTSINVTVDAAGAANIPLTSITITGAGRFARMVNGHTQQLNAAVMPTDATNAAVTWSVRNGTGTATISPTGLLTATGVGIVTVQATANDSSGVFDTMRITIIRPSHSGGNGRSSSAITKSDLTKDTNSTNMVKLTASEVNQSRSLTIKGDGINLILGEDTLTGMNIKTSFEAIIKPVRTEELSAEARAIVGNRPVFDIKVVVDGKPITNTGKLTIEIPYTPQAGEDTSQLAAFYIDDNGTITLMEDSVYDPAKKAIVFSPSHLSVYAIGIKPDEAAKNNSGSNAAIRFIDVASGYWAEEPICYLADRGIVNGKTATTFAPNDKITRAELVTMVAKMSGETPPADSHQFSDVTADAWYASYVAWAAQTGIARGYNGQFHPHDLISRQDMAVMLVNYAEEMGKDTFSKNQKYLIFADDATIAGYAKKAVYAMQQAGFITGQGGNNFAPTADATRAEAAQVISVLLQNMPQ